MKRKRVFKLKTFTRWAKKILTDDQLCEAAREIMAGQYEADLGHGVCKKRIAIEGRGKSGSTRTLVAKSSPHGIFFMAGRSKSDPGADFSAKEVAQAILLAGDLEAANRREIELAIEAGYIKEICNDC